MDKPKARSPGFDAEHAAGRRDAAGVPALPYCKAFVVQFTAETGARLERAAGRVEHLQTGRRSRFASMDELRACIVALLADSATASARRNLAGTRRERRR